MASPTPPPPGPPAPETNLGIAPNVAGLLCYVPCCVGLIFSIVAAVVEKQSRFVRFHAFQSLLAHGAYLVVAIALAIGQIAVAFVAGMLATVVWLVGMLVGLAFIALLIVMMIKANSREEFELPVIGEMAKKWA